MRWREAAVIAFVVALAVAGTVRCSRGDVQTAVREDGDTARPRPTNHEQRPIIVRATARDALSLMQALGCAGCHTGVPAPKGPVARPLAVRDRARDPASTFAYLRDSPRAGTTGEAHTPSFHLDDGEALALSLYLAAGRSGGGAAGRRFNEARRTHGDVNAEVGARIFRALNCTACHAHDGAEPRRNGPPLVGVASRLRPAALRDFLLDSRAVRPFGFEPGSGGRMPDFALSEAEADSIVAFLATLGARSAARESPGSHVLSAFGAAKARALLEQKLSCLGCHALGGEGGRIGPDLARAADRLVPEYIAEIVSDPQHAMPGTVMPRAPLPRETRDLIIAFLVRGGAAAGVDRETGGAVGSSGDTVETERNGYLSLVDHPLEDAGAVHASASGSSPDGGTDPVASLYATRCAMCHGAQGRGDGYNARYLRARPAVHASADAMSRRPDDTLFDGIHAGGAILGGSPEMPAFGESLSAAHIEGLVAYIRRLCDCRQPAWADDGR